MPAEATKRQEELTVFVIEDDRDTRDFVSRVLELGGYRVLQAEDGATGLRLTRETDVSLIVLDLRLSGRDGWQSLKQRSEEPKLLAVPVVAFTASARVAQREEAIRMGATEYLIKPLSSELLKASVDRIVQGRR